MPGCFQRLPGLFRSSDYDNDDVNDGDDDDVDDDDMNVTFGCKTDMENRTSKITLIFVLFE